MALTYTSYLKTEELLELQELKSSPAQHDELLFIIIHQTYELWFKQILHEIDLLREELEAGKPWAALKTMRRILVIMKTLVGQNDILETMTPLSFSSFRKFLESASGFQSVQFRELEILLGMRHKRMFSLHEADSAAFKQLTKRTEESTIWESFITLLQKMGYKVEAPKRENESGLIFNPSQEMQDVIYEIMNDKSEIGLLCEALVDFDEGLQEWRYRHVKMVERTIGNKMGTGGSDGVQYLKNTLFNAVFPDLWEVTTRF